jgi:hypothetical protein
VRPAVSITSISYVREYNQQNNDDPMKLCRSEEGIDISENDLLTDEKYLSSGVNSCKRVMRSGLTIIVS